MKPTANAPRPLPQPDPIPHGAAPLRQIGENIREARLRSVVTQRELAAALGCTRAAIGHYETGTRDISISTLLQIAQALGVSFATLVTLNPTPPADPAPETLYLGQLTRTTGVALLAESTPPALAVAPDLTTIMQRLAQHPELVPEITRLLDTLYPAGA